MKKDGDRFRQLSEELFQLEIKGGRFFQNKNTASVVFYFVVFFIGAAFFSVGIYFLSDGLKLFSVKESALDFLGSFFPAFLAFSFFGGNLMLYFLRRKRYGIIVFILAAAMYSCAAILSGKPYLDCFSSSRRIVFELFAVFVGAAAMVVAFIIRHLYDKKKKR